MAAVLVALQGLGVLVYAILEALSISSSRLTMGASTAVFFAAYGAVLGLCAWGLFRARFWARSPSVLAQLIWLGVAWSFSSGSTTWVAGFLAVMAVVVLVGLLHPRSTAAFIGAE
jgi:hypothetical protein